MCSPELIRNEIEADITLMAPAEKVAHLQALWASCNRAIAEIESDPAESTDQGLWGAYDDLHIKGEHAARLLERMGVKPARVFSSAA